MLKPINPSVGGMLLGYLYTIHMYTHIHMYICICYPQASGLEVKLNGVDAIGCPEIPCPALFF